MIVSRHAIRLQNSCPILPAWGTPWQQHKVHITPSLNNAKIQADIVTNREIQSITEYQRECAHPSTDFYLGNGKGRRLSQHVFIERVTPPIKGLNTHRQATTFTLASTTALTSESPSNLTCMVLHCGRKLTHPEKTHKDTQRDILMGLDWGLQTSSYNTLSDKL